jgi:hypothetical protein
VRSFILDSNFNKFNLTEALYALEVPIDSYFGRKQNLLLRFDVIEREELLILKNLSPYWHTKD